MTSFSAVGAHGDDDAHRPNRDADGTPVLTGDAALQILDQLPVAVFVTGSTGSPVYSNHAAQALLGAARRLRDGESLAGAYGITKVGTSQVYPEHGMPLRRALQGEVAAADDMQVLGTTEPPIPIQAVAAPVRDGEGGIEYATIAFWDISDRRETERALAATRRELEDKNRRLERSNADLEQFAYVASHDLSEPLRAIAGMVALLGKRYRGQLDEDADEFIAFAVEGCERLRAMIEDLLRLSRAASVDLRIEAVDLGEVVAAVATMLRAQLEDGGAELRTGALPVVLADRRQLIQVVQNLVSNAVKFRRADTAAVVEVTASMGTHDMWRIEVSDNGIGIDEAYHRKIFRMFERLHTRDVYAGTGMGLAIAERIIDRHGGRMGVSSNPMGGSTFWFTLPTRVEVDNH